MNRTDGNRRSQPNNLSTSTNNCSDNVKSSIRTANERIATTTSSNCNNRNDVPAFSGTAAKEATTSDAAIEIKSLDSTVQSDLVSNNRH